MERRAVNHDGGKTPAGCLDAAVKSRHQSRWRAAGTVAASPQWQQVIKACVLDGARSGLKNNRAALFCCLTTAITNSRFTNVKERQQHNGQACCVKHLLSSNEHLLTLSPQGLFDSTEKIVTFLLLCYVFSRNSFITFGETRLAAYYSAIDLLDQRPVPADEPSLRYEPRHSEVGFAEQVQPNEPTRYLLHLGVDSFNFGGFALRFLHQKWCTFAQARQLQCRVCAARAASMTWSSVVTSLLEVDRFHRCLVWSWQEGASIQEVSSGCGSSTMQGTPAAMVSSISSL